MKELYRYVWQQSARRQIILSALTVVLFLIELIPLELQRRIVNAAVDHQNFQLIGWLCIGYVAVSLVHGGLKFGLNVYQGVISESAIRHLRRQVLAHNAQHATHASSEREGVAISIVVSEAEAVGGFISSSFYVPVLNGGILISVLCYMIYTQPWLALVAGVLFLPQLLFIPVLQAAINRRTRSLIRVLRAFSVKIVHGAVEKRASDEKKFQHGVNNAYRLNMEIYRRKYGMNFLMNLMFHLGVVGILFVGTWLVIQGKTEVGTIVAFISGLNRMNDPWGDLVDFFRNMTNVVVKFRLIMSTLGKKA